MANQNEIGASPEFDPNIDVEQIKEAIAHYATLVQKSPKIEYYAQLMGFGIKLLQEENVPLGPEVVIH